MDTLTIGARAATRLRDEQGILARDLTAAIYAARPDLLEKHGEYGRRKCHEDMHYNIEHLAPAVHLEMPEIFARYVRWLDELLTARNVGTDEIALTLRQLEKLVRERFEPEEAEEVARSVRAGLAVLE